MVRASLQADDEVLGGAGDHGPAAGVDGVLVPVAEHAVWVDETLPDGDQRLHCTKGARANQTTREIDQPPDGSVIDRMLAA